MNQPQAVLSDELAQAHFEPSFLKVLSSEKLRSVFKDLKVKLSPLQPAGILKEKPQHLLLKVESAQGYIWEINLGVSSSPKALISGLHFRARPSKAPRAGSPLAKRLAWLLKLMEKREALNKSYLEEGLASSFLEKVPVEAMIQSFKGFQKSAPFRVESARIESDYAGELILEGAEDLRLSFNLTLQNKAPHKLIGLFVRPAPPSGPAPNTWKGLIEALGKGGFEGSLYSASIDPVTGVCQPIYTGGTKSAFPIGSTFKLYILSALAEAIQAGELKWSDPLKIQDALKSLPSGVMQEEPEGKSFPILEFAQKMISISDNTATDHLLFKLGREKVEARMKATGHHNPDLNKPFLSTRELFLFRLKEYPKEAQAWLGLDQSARREKLKFYQKLPLPKLSSAYSWIKPRMIKKIEWFATGEDLCHLHADFVMKREQPAYKELLKVISINDGGLRAPKKRWAYTGFKGGSEPGLMVLSYLLKDNAGRWYSLSLAQVHSKEEMGGVSVPYLARAALKLLPKAEP